MFLDTYGLKLTKFESSEARLKLRRTFRIQNKIADIVITKFASGFILKSCK